MKPSRTLLLAFLAATQQAAAQTAVYVGRHFEGIDQSTSSFVPDCNGAVGPAHYVEMINKRCAIYPKDSSGVAVQSNSLTVFWQAALPPGAPTLNILIDPRIIFDATSGRWFASVANGTPPNLVLLAVSNTSDPTGAWQGHAVSADPNPAYVPDFPTLGVNQFGVYLCAPIFAADISHHTLTVVIDKSDMLAGLASPRIYTFTDPWTAVAIPTVDLDSSVAYNAQLTKARVPAQTEFRRREVQYNGVSPPTLVTSDPPFAVQPCGVSCAALTAPQPEIPPGDRRPPLESDILSFSSNVVRRAGAIWAVNTVSYPDGNPQPCPGRLAIHWIQFTDGPSHAILQEGIISDPDLYLFNPAISVNARGDVVIGYHGSSSSQPASAYASAGRTVAGLTHFAPRQLLRAGVDNFNSGGSRNRWGDYTSVNLDPADQQRFWLVDEFVRGNDQWGTYVSEIVICRGDWDRNFVAEPADVSLFVNQWYAGDPEADFDENGVREPADFAAFINAWFNATSQNC